VLAMLLAVSLFFYRESFNLRKGPGGLIAGVTFLSFWVMLVQ